MTKYKRILLKLSGESLVGEQNYGIDENRLQEYAEQILEIVRMGVQVGHRHWRWKYLSWAEWYRQRI